MAMNTDMPTFAGFILPLLHRDVRGTAEKQHPVHQNTTSKLWDRPVHSECDSAVVQNVQTCKNKEQISSYDELLSLLMVQKSVILNKVIVHFYS